MSKINYPQNLRRLRQDPWIRELTQEVQWTPQKLIQPLFVVQGIATRQTIPGLTGVHRDTTASLLTQIESDLEAGVRKFLLFGVPQKKSLNDFASSTDFTASQIESIKKRFGKDLWLSVDVCLCSSTEHGQCGVLDAEGSHLKNHATVHELAKAAAAFAQSGADCVAPSDMMDGRILAIRTALDQLGDDRTLIMSYSAKFHSKFYGPFRAAADSAPKGDVKLKDRATYQIDPTRPGDALASSLRDAHEGADILMLKPGMPYLDVLTQLVSQIQKPWAVYQVSGEYAALELLAREGLIDGPAAHREALTSFFRAGAQMVITYGARNLSTHSRTQAHKEF